MFRLWAKAFRDNRLLQDAVICDDSDDTRTHKVFNALHEVCLKFDFSEPIWLENNIQEFRRHSNGTPKPVSGRTPLSKVSNSIFWKFK